MRKLALLLTFCLFLATLCGCGEGTGAAENTAGNQQTDNTDLAQTDETESQEDITKTQVGEYSQDSPYELTFAFIEFYAQDEDARDAVEDALNDYLIPNYHIQVNFLPLESANYASKVQLMISGSDALDVFPVYSTNVSSWINMKGIVDLEPYMDTEDGQKIVEALGEEKAYVCRMNGILYGFPANKESCSLVGLCMRADLCDALGLTQQYDLDKNGDVYEGRVYDWNVATGIFQKVKDAYPEMTPLYLSGTSSQAGYLGFFDILSDNLGVLDWESDHNSTTVVNKYETETYREIVTLLAQWYDAGYIYPDAAIDTQGSATMMKSGNTFSYLTPIKPGFLTEAKAANGMECYVMYFGQDVEAGLRTDNVCFYNTSIAANSKDPEMAFKFIAALYSDPVVMNLWQYGIEGKDYQVLEDNTAYYPQGVDDTNYKYHQNSGWCMGNQFISYVWNDGTKDADYWDKLMEREKWAVYSPAFGFAWDSSEYQNEITALQNALETYRAALETGSIGGVQNVDTVLAQLNEALYDAGLQKVMDAKQEQLDAWLAENGPAQTPEENLEKIKSVTQGVLTE